MNGTPPATKKATIPLCNRSCKTFALLHLRLAQSVHVNHARKYESSWPSLITDDDNADSQLVTPSHLLSKISNYQNTNSSERIVSKRIKD